MGLPAPAPSRQLKHRRQIDVQVYSRGDGLWEVDAQLVDTKTRDWPLPSGIRPAGAPIHDMLLRLVVDEQLNIREAGARTDSMPYPGYCDDYGNAYGRLVGLNLLRGFRRAVQERLGGTLGCTHLTEMSQVLPTAVIQAFANEVLDVQDGSGGLPASGQDERPFQIDRCHALRRDAPAVAVYYPRWYQRGTASAPPTEPSA